MAAEVLFNLHNALEAVHVYPRHALERLQRFSEADILNNSTEHLAEVVLAEYSLDVPVVSEADAWVEESEVQVPKLSGYRRGPYSEPTIQLVRAHFAVFHLPFTGNRDVFRFQPSTRTLSGLSADIRADELVMSFNTAGKDESRLRAEVDSAVAEIKNHLDQLRKDFASLPGQIRGAIVPGIDTRRATLLKQTGTVANLGFPMKRRADAPSTYRAPEVRRKITPTFKPSGAGAPFKPEPTMDEADYKHILTVIENMTMVMERSPTSFKAMGEEDLRQQYLVQLNGQYEGNATGETFNAAGKTDILVRSENANIFIAECKIWRGEKVMAETIDQLLSYTTWRDTKTAIIVFNRNKGFSGVIDAANAAMAAHKQFRRGPVKEGDTRFRYVFANPKDDAKEVIVTLMLFDIPS